MPSKWWVLALSMTRTEFGSGYGFIASRRTDKYSLNSALVQDLVMMSRCRTPDREIAGRIE
jgi:hypothetical protein